MTSWVYIFSKFTNEALLFEALGIFLLCAGYAAFWVLRKRRHGVIRDIVPGGVVKDYLNLLIGDAEQLRVQLFGLLASSGIQIVHRAAPIAVDMTGIAPGAVAADPELQKKVSLLEAKMVEQARAMETITTERARLEKELAEARAAGSGPSDGGDTALLKDRIATLEGKLAEYSVIEDDLANLKRLQQENAQLKAMLNNQSAAAPAPAPAAAAAAPAPAPASPPPAAAPDSNPLADLLNTDANTESAFENLADQLGASLMDESAPAPPAGATAAPPAPAPAPSAAGPAVTPQPAAPAANKMDEDLVAEFEKMLNS